MLKHAHRSNFVEAPITRINDTVIVANEFQSFYRVSLALPVHWATHTVLVTALLSPLLRLISLPIVSKDVVQH